MLKIRRPLGRLIFNMGIAIPGKTVFLIETAPWVFKSGKINVTTMKHVGNDTANFIAKLGCSFWHEWATDTANFIAKLGCSFWHEWAIISHWNIQWLAWRVTCLCYTQDYLKPGTCSSIKPDVLEKLMSFPTNIQSHEDTFHTACMQFGPVPKVADGSSTDAPYLNSHWICVSLMPCVHATVAHCCSAHCSTDSNGRSVPLKKNTKFLPHC